MEGDSNTPLGPVGYGRIGNTDPEAERRFQEAERRRSRAQYVHMATQILGPRTLEAIIECARMIEAYVEGRENG